MATDLERAVLAGEPWQRAGLGEGDVGAIIGLMHRFGENERAEGRRRQVDHLPVGEMRRQRAGDIGLREGGGGAEDQIGAAHGLGDVRRDQREPGVMPAARILHGDAGTFGALLRHGLRVAPPQPDLVALQREVARRREGAVAAAEYGDDHDMSHVRGVSWKEPSP